MLNVANLKARTVKDLAALAKRKGVPGWHAMRKEELIRALLKYAKTAPAAKTEVGANGQKKIVRPANGHHNGNGIHSNGTHRNGSHQGGKGRPSKALLRLKQLQAKLTRSRDLAGEVADGQRFTRDRLIVMVRDPYWLHAYWELTRPSIERARVAMGERWHGAKPVLRVAQIVRDGTESAMRNVIRDIEIHGRVNNWYVDVTDPPKTFQLDVGYLAEDGKFLSLARSNVVTTPACGAGRTLDGNWAEVAEDFDRIYALSGGYSNEGDNSELKDLFEHRLRRPMGSPMVTRFGLGACGVGRGHPDFSFEVDTELVVYGVTDPDAHVTLRGEPVKLQPDGSFTVRMSMPDRRQVLPVVASSGDGTEQRTVVLAVEKNTKVMEPVLREPDA